MAIPPHARPDGARVAADHLSKYLKFNRMPPPEGGSTQVWAVVSKSSDAHLGLVKWYAKWRQYCFFPRQGTIWNPDCLDEVAAFTRAATKEHRLSHRRSP